ncbi:uncharacterized protein LOC114939264 [Nylanderia fulva]|uniref:uncharacterized protein LOC114939264 n=1 Tax=Nylanderia fulva TaxID=613905 RepID=UPI0010FB2590|nr:uncharacterized protein LOC114939264 [Nylanderia fulva]
MFKAMEYVYGTHRAWKNMEGYITTRVRYILRALLERIKYEEIDDRDQLRICLRQEAARWACFLDDLNCKEVANRKLEHHLLDPTKHKLLPWWKEWTYCKGLMIATNETWQSVYNIGLNKSDTKFLEYLACTKDDNMIKNYLRYQSISKKESQYFLNSFLYIITKHSKNLTILPYILDNLLNIRPK